MIKDETFCGIDVKILNFFHKKGCINKDNQGNFVNYKITFQRFEKKDKRHVCQKKILFNVLKQVLALHQMKVCHF